MILNVNLNLRLYDSCCEASEAVCRQCDSMNNDLSQADQRDDKQDQTHLADVHIFMLIFIEYVCF